MNIKGKIKKELKKVKSGILKIDMLFLKGNIRACHSRYFKYRGKAYKLTKDIYFPPHIASNSNVRMGPSGELLAIGGDLSSERIIYAFKNGIYPMFFKNDPILWWTSNTRCILYLEKLHIGRDVKKFLKNQKFNLTTDTAFEDVVNACSELRKGDTWLTSERIDASIKLHESGFAHSVEIWINNNLIGGLFGILIGSYFYLESMFMRIDHSSKVAFIALSLRLKELDFFMIDLGIWPTDNLLNYGAEVINRDEYLKLVNKSISMLDTSIEWGELFENWDLKRAVEKHLMENR